MNAHFFGPSGLMRLKWPAAMLFAACLSLQAAPAAATGFHLPHDKTYMESCRAAALAAHPGNVERVVVHNDGSTVRVRFYIQKPGERVQWIVICDGKTGKIHKTIQVDDS
jgi:hypothetical protein